MKNLSINDLTNDIIMGIYDGLSRNDNLNPIYFDCHHLDVGSVVDGYFSSNIKNQEIANRELMNKIISGAPKDEIDDRDDMRYVLINQISFNEFIEEFSLMSKNEEPYKSFIIEFCQKIEDIHDLEITDINTTYDLQKQFASELMMKFKDKRELISDFPNIFNFTTTNLSISWAVKTLWITEPFRIKRSGRTWNM